MRTEIQRLLQRKSAGPSGVSLCWFLPQNIDAAVAICEEEHVVVVIPGDLIHLELELLLCPGAMRLGIDEGHHIVFVPDSDGLTVGAPADVDVLS